MNAASAPATTTAAVRWRLLSLGFTVPTAESLRELEVLAEALRELENDAVLDALLDAARMRSGEDLRAQHHELFGGTVRVPPYEGSYQADPIRQGRELADVAAFYRAFGAAADGPAFERPDHVGCELEFLAFLELRRLAASEAEDPEAEALLDEIATAFLADHAGRWLPVFFEDLREAAPGSLYGWLATFGERVLREELGRRELAPASVRRRPVRLPVERDSFDCA